MSTVRHPPRNTTWLRLTMAVWLMAMAVLAMAAVKESLAGKAVLVELTGVVGPATVDHVKRTIDEAADQGAVLVVVRMDTPGGLDSSLRDLVKHILGAPVPVVTWVAPAGSRAASAGTYILLASHGAVMASSTHLGAATPVTMGGMPGSSEPAEEPQDSKPDEDGKRRGASAMERKMLEDAVAYIRGLAEHHDRNADWAEEAVREGSTLTASQAVEKGVIDFIADDMQSLLKQLHGREVRMADGTRTLDSADLAVIEREADWRTRFLATITSPNVAYFLMLLGFYGLIFEFSNPGQVYPGVIGAICLVLAMYSFQVLPINYAGLALIILGLGFMVAEAFVPSFGILGLGGLVAFVFGSVILLDHEHLAISVPMIAGTALVSLGFFSWVLGRLMGIRRRPVLAGMEEMLAMDAVAQQAFVGEGWVRIHGETWRAFSDVPIQAGEHVRVTRVDGLTLTVTPKTTQPQGEPS
jgi:membrane-bound serine protease (ClpP class)